MALARSPDDVLATVTGPAGPTPMIVIDLYSAVDLEELVQHVTRLGLCLGARAELEVVGDRNCGDPGRVHELALERLRERAQLQERSRPDDRRNDEADEQRESRPERERPRPSRHSMAILLAH